MLYFKTIRLEPTNWSLDVIVGTDADQIATFCAARYGYSKEYHEEDADGDWVSRFDSKEDSELKGERRIIMKLRDLKNKGIMIHELMHVLFYLEKATAIEINWSSQEWVAIFMERTWNELCRPTYEKIKK